MARIVSGVSRVDQLIGGKVWQENSVAAKPVIFVQALAVSRINASPVARNAHTIQEFARFRPLLEPQFAPQLLLVLPLPGALQNCPQSTEQVK